MRYFSVCSGVEAASVAWHDLGWTPVGFSEIEPFPSAVLAHRFPGVKNYGDLTKFRDWGLVPGDFDLLVGGTPCQAFSVAGLRKGLADPRGNLALIFLALADLARPEWILWENVPGVLSSGDGRDFGSFLGALGELGYGYAYRVLDAQYVGGCQLHGDAFGRGPVPQRRRRVFVVAHLGDAAPAASVLFDQAGLHRNPPAKQSARQGAAADAGGRAPGRRGKRAAGAGAELPLGDGAGTAGAGGHGSDREWPAGVAPTLPAAFGQKLGLDDQHALGGAGLFTQDAPVWRSSDQANAETLVDVAGTLNCNKGQHGGILFPPAGQTAFGTLTARYGASIGAPEVDAGLLLSTTIVPKSIGDFREAEVAKTILRNSGGGGETQNPAFVVQQKSVHAMQDTMATLCAADSKGASQQYVEEGKVLVEQQQGGVAFAFDGFQSDNPKATTQFTVEGSPPLIANRPHCVGKALEAPAPVTVLDIYNQSASHDVSPPLTVGNVGNTLPHILEPLPFDTTQVTHPANRSNPKHGDPCHPLAAGGHPPAIAFQLSGDRANPGVSVSAETAFTLPANPMSDRGQAVAVPARAAAPAPAPAPAPVARVTTTPAAPVRAQAPMPPPPPPRPRLG